MFNKQRVLLGVLLTALFFTGNSFALADDSLVTTPNADFNDISNALVSSGAVKSVSANGDVLVGNPGDPVASFSAQSGDWVFYYTDH